MSDDEEIQNPPASIEIGTLSFTEEAAPEKEAESTAVVEEKRRFVFFVCASKIQPLARNARGCQVKSVFPLSGLWQNAH